MRSGLGADVDSRPLPPMLPWWQVTQWEGHGDQCVGEGGGGSCPNRFGHALGAGLRVICCVGRGLKPRVFHPTPSIWRRSLARKTITAVRLGVPSLLGRSLPLLAQQVKVTAVGFEPTPLQTGA